MKSTAQAHLTHIVVLYECSTLKKKKIVFTLELHTRLTAYIIVALTRFHERGTLDARVWRVQIFGLKGTASPVPGERITNTFRECSARDRQKVQREAILRFISTTKREFTQRRPSLQPPNFRKIRIFFIKI